MITGPRSLIAAIPLLLGTFASGPLAAQDATIEAGPSDFLEGYYARLREQVTRDLEDGVFRYRPQSEPADLMREVVQDFVETRLAGSLSPFVAYLAQAENLTDDEIESLRRIVDALPDRRVDGE